MPPLCTHQYVRIDQYSNNLYCPLPFFISLHTPGPRPLKKGTFDTNATINSEGSGDMSSTQYNQI